MSIDLHTHSDVSDGSETPARIIELAAAGRLRAVALTDHDTLEGIPAAEEAADHAGIEFVPGVELSCNWTGGGCHIVVLWLRPGEGPLQDRLAELQDGRDGRNDRILERLSDLGITITAEELAEQSGGGVTGRPHIAALMVKKGLVESVRHAFDEFLGNGKPAYVDRARLDPEDAIGLARESGAVTVLAHPHTLGLDNAAEYRSALDRLASAGLAGMECWYGEYSPAYRRSMVTVARSHGLVPSGGSDFHGLYKPGLRVGSGRGDLVVPDHILDELAARRFLPTTA